MGFSDDDVVITFVSRLVWEKNLKLFANVVNRLQNEYSFVKSMVVGDGPARNEMQEIMPDTQFAGFLTGEDLAKSYASSDIFFFPSDTETFGNVTLEAMASGLPCLVADAPGSKSLIKHGKNGFLVPVGDENEFFQHAKNLTVNKRLREELAAESRRRSAEFTWEKINAGLFKHYMEIMDKTTDS